MPTSTTVHFPFPVDGAVLPVFACETPPHWHAAAEAKGFTVIGRAVDRLHVVLGCHACGRPTLKRVSVVLGYNPECGHCIRDRRVAAAERLGARLIGPDPEGNRHYGEYMLACGHVARRQHTRVEDAAAGGHALGCETCLDARLEAEAGRWGWRLAGPAARDDRSYRRYEHACGHRQDVAVANMRWGDVDCAGCGETWTSKPSRLYLLEFALPGLPVIKLGYSSDPEYRLRQLELDPARTRGAILREIAVETGHRAVCVEKALHVLVRSRRPDLAVPPELFRDHLRAVSEIYHRRGLPWISRLLDDVEAGRDPSASCAPDPSETGSGRADPDTSI